MSALPGPTRPRPTTPQPSFPEHSFEDPGRGAAASLHAALLDATWRRSVLTPERQVEGVCHTGAHTSLPLGPRTSAVGPTRGLAVPACSVAPRPSAGGRCDERTPRQ